MRYFKLYLTIWKQNSWKNFATFDQFFIIFSDPLSWTDRTSSPSTPPLSTLHPPPSTLHSPHFLDRAVFTPTNSYQALLLGFKQRKKQQYLSLFFCFFVFFVSPVMTIDDRYGITQFSDDMMTWVGVGNKMLEMLMTSYWNREKETKYQKNFYFFGNLHKLLLFLWY